MPRWPASKRAAECRFRYDSRMTHVPHDNRCTDPASHVDDAQAFVSEVELACAERGLRLTELRGQVLRLVAQAGQPVKAYDLLDRMKSERGATAPPTVYRALDFLLQNGFIHRLSSINAFVACHHPRVQGHSAPFLICDRCQRTVEMEDEETAVRLQTQARALGFSPQGQTLEVHGLCAECCKSET